MEKQRLRCGETNALDREAREEDEVADNAQNAYTERTLTLNKFTSKPSPYLHSS